MILAAACFALMSACAKLGAAHFHSIELLFWRTSIGAALLGAPMMLRGHSPATPHWRAHIQRGFIGYASMAALFYALTRLPLSTAVTLNYTSSLFFSALCIVKLKDRPPPHVWLALLAGFVGVALLLRPTLTPQQWLPGLIGLVSGISAGFAVFQVRELGQMGEQPWRVVFWFFCLSSLIGLAWLLLGPGFSAITMANVWPLLGVGLFGLLGQLAMTRAYKEGRRYLVASFAYLTVVFSAVLGVILWNDGLGVGSALAMVLIVSAGMLAARS
ncbi:EamA family transporter [Chromobacterium alticapitis]|uniref:EamA family transporter n=2 Tax=Chromobacterium alticapitis TaxID=2073169 RepID=A0A2S5DB88_9NEIS|nr:EamA family transporter [Chromobacterium alticapitis]